ncbi:50S ribosomal protein L1 [Candidatus Saccharibacteria bacterium]|nr:50S ribosomal protein L1 [Candidatus Saccharibacteria bacterium]
MAEVKKPVKTASKKSKVKKVEEKKDGIIQESIATPTEANQQGQEVTEAPKKTTTKAGKHSPKAIKEAEELQAKEARKATKTEAQTVEAKKPVKAPTRTHEERAGKKFRAAAKLIEKDKQYGIKEALELAIKTATTKFDSTVELHINLGVDPRQADQNVRDNLVLPNGTGKTVRVAVLAEADDAAAAKKAGADIAGHEELLKEIEKGKIDFDILIATPALMAKLGKFARILGPKGLMPNPKSGTVTPDVVKAVQQSKAGRVEYRVDSTGIVHLGVGKVSFGADKLNENTQAVFASIKSNKPSSIKGNYVKTITVTTTMGPGIRVLISEL